MFGVKGRGVDTQKSTCQDGQQKEVPKEPLPSVVEHAFNIQADFCEFQISLIYIVSLGQSVRPCQKGDPRWEGEREREHTLKRALT